MGAWQWTPGVCFTLSSVPVILEMEGHPEEASHTTEQVVVHGVMVVRTGKHPPQRLSAWN